MDLTSWTKKRVVIAGLGVHGGGLAVAKWLLKQGARLTVTDLKTQSQLQSSIDKLEQWRRRYGLQPVEYVLGRHRISDFTKADLIIQNPGMPSDVVYLQRARFAGVPILNEAALFFALVKMPIIAVTGSKGKSTTTALLGHIFRQVYPQTIVAGNIRETVMFDVIDKILSWQKQGKEIPIILELSSWHLEGLPAVKRSPHVAVITNILPDHLNRYKSFTAYRRAKEIITAYQGSNDWLVVNKKDKNLVNLSKRTKAQVLFFESKQVPKSWKIKIPGQHNLTNIAAALQVAKIYSLPRGKVRQAVESFSGLACRLEFVGEFAGVKFYNDSCATAPVATSAALQVFRKKVILLAGGSDKNLPLTDLAQIIRRKAKFCFLFAGDGSERLKKELQRQHFPLSKLQDGFEDINEMLRAVKQVAKSGDIVLLSPGFASFSTFANEFDRADKFVQAVKKFNQL